MERDEALVMVTRGKIGGGIEEERNWCAVGRVAAHHRRGVLAINGGNRRIFQCDFVRYASPVARGPAVMMSFLDEIQFFGWDVIAPAVGAIVPGPHLVRHRMPCEAQSVAQPMREDA